MKKNIEMKKVICTALSALTLASSLLTTVPAYAFEGDPDFDMIYVERENGNIRYVDEDGNEVDLGGGMLFTQTADDLPSSYDSRDFGYITPVKSQRGTGDCWAFSAINALETDSIVKGYTDLEDTDFSEAHLAWFANNSLVNDESDPTHGDGVAEENPHTCGGNWQDAAASLARWSGVANESDFPFNNSDISKMSYGEEDRYNAGSGIAIESAQVLSDIVSTKQWIMEHGSAIVSYYSNDTYYNNETYAYYSGLSYKSNHAVSIVGWDDNYSAENFKDEYRPSSDGAWLCKNSWGSGWGNDGYFWLSYSETTIHEISGISVQRLDNYHNNYTYNGAHWSGAYNLSYAAQAANVFTSKGNEKITAVGIQTGAATEVIAKIYKNLPENYKNPADGVNVASTTVTVDGEGYHTIYLDEEVFVEKGEIFAIVIQYNGLAGKTVIPLEVNYDSISTQYHSEAGQSYLNFSTRETGWRTAQSQGAENVCIQALTECGHEFSSVKTEATCTESGIETVACTQCGEFLSEEIIPATGHEFGQWITHPYDEEAGARVSERTCLGCGETEKRIDTNVKVVTIDNFFATFFARLIQAIKTIFTVG